MKVSKRIAFMGTPNIAVPYLQTLIDNQYNIVAVYTQPARPKGRGLYVHKSPVAKLALKYKLHVFTTTKLDSDKEIKNFQKLKIDLIIVMGYGNLIPKFYLEQVPFGCINVHVSLLPRWRGAAPIERALLAGDKVSGVTIFRLDEKLDSGPILVSKSCKISNSIQKKDLENKLTNIGKKLLVDTLPKYFLKKINLKKQNSLNITYARKIDSLETQVYFFDKAHTIYNKVRAFSPKPGAWFLFNQHRIKILSWTR